MRLEVATAQAQASDVFLRAVDLTTPTPVFPGHFTPMSIAAIAWQLVQPMWGKTALAGRKRRSPGCQVGLVRHVLSSGKTSLAEARDGFLYV